MLHEVKLVVMDEFYEIVQSTDFGTIMARYFVSLKTMKEFAEVCLMHFIQLIRTREMPPKHASLSLSFPLSLSNCFQLCGTESTEDIFNKIVSSDEFATTFRLRHNEKKVLNDICRKLRAEPVSITLLPNGTVKNVADKVSW